MWRLRKKPKYANEKTRGFASKKERERYDQLCLMQKAGLISKLRTQIPYKLSVNGSLICKYIADFVYYDEDLCEEVVEDAKGFRTRDYRIKSKLMNAVHGIKIREV